MQAKDSLWRHQLLENMHEISYLYDSFKTAKEVNFENLDESRSRYEVVCYSYGLNNLNFKDFIDLGKSLRGRQASSKRNI